MKMSNAERIVIWPIGIVMLAFFAVLYLAWCWVMAMAGFTDWVREDD